MGGLTINAKLTLKSVDGCKSFNYSHGEYFLCFLSSSDFFSKSSFSKTSFRIHQRFRQFGSRLCILSGLIWVQTVLIVDSRRH